MNASPEQAVKPTIRTARSRQARLKCLDRCMQEDAEASERRASRGTEPRSHEQHNQESAQGGGPKPAGSAISASSCASLATRRYRTRWPGAAGDREGPHPPRAGSAAAAQGPSARGGASLRHLSRAGRHKHLLPGGNARPPPGRRRATRQRATIEIRVKSESVFARERHER